MIRDTDSLATRTFDVAVVGGGIHGACLAWDAALRGLSTCLVERDDFGAGTSANSLKIIHGGLRYLQAGNLRRARSSSRERTALLRVAPHLVKPGRFLIPIYSGAKHGKLAFRAGLALNDIVSWDRNRGVSAQHRIPRGRVVSSEEVLGSCPWLRREGLRGGATWHDGLAHNTERLTLDFLDDAAERGATVVNHAELVGFLRKGSRIVGMQVMDRVSGKALEVRARAVVNAVGPWLEQVLSMARGAGSGTRVEPARLAKAINLVFRRERGETAAGVYSELERRDDPAGSRGRYLFVVPWNGFTMVGTWYRLVAPDSDTKVNEEDLREALAEIDECCPDLGVTWEDLSSYHCGMLPVSKDRRSGATHRLADSTRILDHGALDDIPGLFSIVGVKYTTARLVAERALDVVVRTEQLLSGACRTAHTMLKRGIPPQSPRGESLSVPDDTRRRLTAHYGSQSEELLEEWSKDGDLVPLTEASSWLRGEILHALRHEMAIRLGDVVFRRTGMGAATCPSPSELEAASRIMGAELEWGESRRESEIRDVVSRYSPLPLEVGVRP